MAYLILVSLVTIGFLGASNCNKSSALINNESTNDLISSLITSSNRGGLTISGIFTTIRVVITLLLRSIRNSVKRQRSSIHEETDEEPFVENIKLKNVK